MEEYSVSLPSESDSAREKSLTQQITDLSEPEEEKGEKLQTFISTSVRESFRGPLPPPVLLKEYNEAVTDGAERVFKMTEKQLLHRMQLEDHAVKEDLKQSRNGQLFGFILSLTGLCLATLLAMSGHETIAGIFGTTTVIGLVTVFVIGKRIQQKSLAEKE